MTKACAYPKFHRRRLGRRDVGGYLPSAVANAYNFPTSPSAATVSIGIVELGGGYLASDLQTAFAAMDLPTPHVTDLSVSGAVNSPGDDADAEVALDLQVA